MDLCPICESRLNDASCPSCPKDLLEAHVKMLAEGGFKLKAWPEQGMAPAEKLKPLRVALLKESWMVAEYEWLKLTRGSSGASEDARRLRARCFEKLAFLLEGLVREKEASHMRARAEALLKPPVLVPKSEQRAATYDFMHQIKEDEGSSTHISKEAEERLNAALARDEKRNRSLKLAAFGAAGLVGGPIMGVNALISGAVGLGLGGIWTLLKR